MGTTCSRLRRDAVAHEVALEDFGDADHLSRAPDVQALQPAAQQGITVVLREKQAILVLQGGLGKQHQGHPQAAGGEPGREIAVGTHCQKDVGPEGPEQLELLAQKSEISPDQPGHMAETPQPSAALQAPIAVRPGAAGRPELQVDPVAQAVQGRGDSPDLGGRADGPAFDIIVIIEI